MKRKENEETDTNLLKARKLSDNLKKVDDQARKEKIKISHAKGIYTRTAY